MSGSSSPLFLRACAGEPVERTPVWLMRQAGRYMSEYRALREKYDFWTLCRTPELAAQVTMQPIDAIEPDAAILFSDILVVLPPMGREVAFNPAPVLESPVRSRSDIDGLKIPDPVRDLGYVMDAVTACRSALAGRVPLIGFGGAPLTLAAYMVEGGGSKHFIHLKSLFHDDPEAARALLDKLVETQAAYLSAQIDAGAQAIQIFDTWGGSMSRGIIEAFVIPAVQRLIERIRRPGVPIIYFMKDAAHVFDLLARTGADMLSVDERTPLSRAAAAIGPGPSLQGNFDPVALFSTPEHITREVEAILDDAPAGRGHVFNLGHGILPGTPFDHVVHLIREVKRLSSRARGART